MNAKYWQNGKVLDYTPETAVKNGAVVSLGTRIGIAGSDIAAGEQGQIHVVGVFEMDKDTAVAIEAGDAVYYDADNDVINTTTTGVPAGYAVASAATEDATVLVKLLG